MPGPDLPINTPAARLAALPLGTRVVVRYRIEGGATDALGYLRSIDGLRCTVETRRGLSTISLAAVVAAKPVPPAPSRRAPRVPVPHPDDQA